MGDYVEDCLDWSWEYPLKISAVPFGIIPDFKKKGSRRHGGRKIIC